jgi:3'(2'), 5'-bisphosphate nucleotidase
LNSRRKLRMPQLQRCDTPHATVLPSKHEASKQMTVAAIDAGLIEGLTNLVSEAAAAILSIGPSALAIRNKADQSPVTAADEVSDAAIAKGLSRLLPGVSVISEETMLRPTLPGGASFALVDPLDGTKEFLAGNGEYTVNVALVVEGVPAAGFIAAPARGIVYRGVVGRGAERLALLPGARVEQATEVCAIRTRRRPAEGLVAAVSRSHLEPATEALLRGLPINTRLPCGSALKFCYIADGTADIYPRLSPTSEWDIAAGDAIIAAAGGVITAPDGHPLSYGRATAQFRVPGFVAWGDVASADTLRPALTGLGLA